MRHISLMQSLKASASAARKLELFFSWAYLIMLKSPLIIQGVLMGMEIDLSSSRNAILWSGVDGAYTFVTSRERSEEVDCRRTERVLVVEDEETQIKLASIQAVRMPPEALMASTQA
jgi:hypothetical protein